MGPGGRVPLILQDVGTKAVWSPTTFGTDSLFLLFNARVPPTFEGSDPWSSLISHSEMYSLTYLLIYLLLPGGTAQHVDGGCESNKFNITVLGWWVDPVVDVPLGWWVGPVFDVDRFSGYVSASEGPPVLTGSQQNTRQSFQVASADRRPSTLERRQWQVSLQRQVSQGQGSQERRVFQTERRDRFRSTSFVHSELETRKLVIRL